MLDLTVSIGCVTKTDAAPAMPPQSPDSLLVSASFAAAPRRALANRDSSVYSGNRIALFTIPW